MKLRYSLLITLAITMSAFRGIAREELTVTIEPEYIDNDQYVTEREKEFIKDALEDNLKAIAWTQAGMEKGTGQALKDDARRMLKDHQDIDNNFRSYIAKNNLIITDVDGTGNVNFFNIKRKKGLDWDEEWVDEMTKNQRKMIERFENARAYVADAELLKLIDKTLPVLRTHVETLVKLKGRLY